MSDEPVTQKVYAKCTDCNKMVDTDPNPNGTRTQVKHNGRGQRKQCPGSFRVITGWPATSLCAYGCGTAVSLPGFACEACQQWAADVRKRIAAADKAAAG